MIMSSTINKSVNKLLFAERKLRRIINSNADGIVVVDKKGIISFVNPAAESIFGQKKVKLLGKTFGFPIATDEASEIEILSKKESLIAEMRAVEAEWEGEIAFFISLRDITERKHIEDELRKTSSTLEMTVEELEKHKKVIEEKNRMLNNLSIKDGLTDLYNHRHMNEVLEKEFGRSRRYNKELSCLLIDLDYFKEINDTFGHAFGDFVLKEFSRCLKSNLRDSDICFRYGGEEFMVLLPNADINGAKTTAEKIRKFTEEKVFINSSKSVSITVSIGIASMNHHRPKKFRDLLSYTDKALYRAKAEGRNRISVYLEEYIKSVVSTKESVSRDFSYFKEQLSLVLEKTKKSSFDSIELLLRNGEDHHLNDNRQKSLNCINLIGEKLNLPSHIIDIFNRAAKLHDCFNCFIRKEVLNKKAILNKKERIEIESHPCVFSDMIGLFDFFSNEREILLFHHENYDGSGYPERLEGEQIPLMARLFSIIHAFVAMTSERPYRKELTPEEVIEELVKNAGKQFDPILVTLFLDIINEKKLLALSGKIFMSAKKQLKQIINTAKTQVEYKNLVALKLHSLISNNSVKIPSQPSHCYNTVHSLNCISN